MGNTKQELDKIKDCISDPKFLTNKGQSNEVGIHVFCYDPADELIVRDYIERILATPSDEYRILEFDLYKIFMEILTEKRVIGSMPGIEEKRGKDFLLSYLQTNYAKPQAFLEKMKYEPHEQGKDVIFLTGIGKINPFMRSHIILNAMQQMFSDVPILMFYPGSFNGQDLNLFDKFYEGNYYRGFNLYRSEESQ